MSVTIDIVDQDCFTALATFFNSFLPSGTEVVQAQDNNVPMPTGGFVTMNNTGMVRFGTNLATYNATAQTKAIVDQTQYTMQCDFYGPDSQSWAIQAVTLFRDEYATQLMPANIQPLYCDDGMQVPLIDAESQWEQRWKVLFHLQYNPTITVPQQSATAVDLGIKPVEVFFKT